MTILLFVAVLMVLIFIHELGHFVFAKMTGCRVDEFAIGFRPAVLQQKYKGTNYVLGFIPLGGYVKIWGENGSSEAREDPQNPHAFYNRPRLAQALVLLGGIIFNIAFAWVMFSVMFMLGTEVVQSQYPDYQLDNPRVEVFGVLEGSSADRIGITVGDRLVSISAGEQRVTDNAEAMRAFIGAHADEDLKVQFEDSTGALHTDTVSTQEHEDRRVVGFDIDTVGDVQLSFIGALNAGARLTKDLTLYIGNSLVTLIGGLFSNNDTGGQLSGPIGIASFAQTSLDRGVDDFSYFVGLLSLNLALFNLIPFPALDGGRLVFVAIESIIRRPLNPNFFLWVNGIGFFLLIGLMIFVTYHDIVRIIL